MEDKSQRFGFLALQRTDKRIQNICAHRWAGQITLPCRSAGLLCYFLFPWSLEKKTHLQERSGLHRGAPLRKLPSEIYVYFLLRSTETLNSNRRYLYAMLFLQLLDPVIRDVLCKILHVSSSQILDFSSAWGCLKDCIFVVSLQC